MDESHVIMLEGLKEVKMLLEKQGERVRKNTEELAAAKEWRENVQFRFDEVMKGIDNIRNDLKVMRDRGDDRHTVINTRLTGLENINLENKGWTEWMKRNGITLLVVFILAIGQVANTIDLASLIKTIH